MKLSDGEYDSIIQLLTRIYRDISALEQEYGLMVGDHDFRPRIEYFHDAVRAFSAQDNSERRAGGRLSVEMLAYDLSCLRFLEGKPLSPFRPHSSAMSPSTEMIKTGKGLAVKATKPDRAVRERLSELYQNYAMLFAALLKAFADRDYQDRVEDLNQDVLDINAIMQQLNGKGNINDLVSAVRHLNDEGLADALLEFIEKQSFKKREELQNMQQHLKQQMAKKDKEIAAIEEAHMNYSLSQLAIFEGSKDVLKKMARQGMNIIGEFVQSAMAETKREMGR